MKNINLLLIATILVFSTTALAQRGQYGDAGGTKGLIVTEDDDSPVGRVDTLSFDNTNLVITGTRAYIQDQGAAGAGDITDVGPAFATGAAFTDGAASTGTTMLIWEGTGVDANEFSLIAPSANPLADIDITFPGATATLATLALAEVLTNKTLTAPAINGVVGTTGLTLPAFTMSGTLTRAGNQTIDLTGATTRTLEILNSTASQVTDLDVDGEVQIRDGDAANAIILGHVGLTASRQVDFQDAAGTVALLEASQTYSGATTSWTSATASRPRLNVTNTNSDATGARLQFFKDGTTAADDDSLGIFAFRGDDSAGNDTEYAHIIGLGADITNTVEGGEVLVNARMNNTMRTLARFSGFQAAAVNEGVVHFNVAEQDVDFIWSRNSATTGIFGEGSTGNVGILNNSPAVALDVTGEVYSSLHLTIGGGAVAQELRLLEASGSGTEYTSFAAVPMAANVAYTLPPDDGDAGEQLQTDGAGVLTWEAAGGAGATAWDDIGDPDAIATIDFAGFDQDITSAEDGGDILTIYNTDADRAAESIIVHLQDADADDPESIYLRMTQDQDGTPATDYEFAQDGLYVEEHVGLGSAAVSTIQFLIDGDGDVIQALIQGNATQTQNLLIIEASDGTTEYFEVEGDGDIRMEQQTASRALFMGATNLLTTTGTSAFLSASLSDETGTGVAVFGTSPVITTSLSQDGDVADAGYLRLQNASIIGWEASPAGTDVTLTVDVNEIMQSSGTFNAAVLTEGGNGVPNSTNNLSFFSATTSAQLAGVISNETGTGALMFGTAPTVTTSLSQSGDAADAGFLRLQNAANIAWEASPAGTDYTLGVDASEILQASGAFTSAGLITGTGGGTFSGGTLTAGTLAGALDAGGATSFEIVNANNPTVDAEGEIAWDADDENIRAYSGTEAEAVVVAETYKIENRYISQPDLLQAISPNVHLFHVDALWAPFGIEIDQVSIQLEADAAYSMVFEEWSGADPPVAQADIETVTTGAADTYAEDNTITNNFVDADDWIVLDLPATDVPGVTVTIIYHILTGD